MCNSTGSQCNLTDYRQTSRNRTERIALMLEIVNKSARCLHTVNFEEMWLTPIVSLKFHRNALVLYCTLTWTDELNGVEHLTHLPMPTSWIAMLITLDFP